jgi:hypothetical protein
MGGFDYLSFLKNYGTGSRGASGFYSNMNRSMPGLGNMMQRGQQANNLKYMTSGLNQFAQGNIKEGVKSGIGYALNQNPYIAGINLFNDITGGIRFDKMLGMGPKKPQVTAGQRATDANFAQQMADDRNAYLQQASQASDQAQRYNEYVNAQRNILRDMQQNGPSARTLAPMLGQFANINEQAAGAARSNTAMNLSQRGISAGSGIGIGATTGVENALAANQGQQRATIANQVLQDVAQFRNQMTAQDAAAADKAYSRAAEARDSAAMLPIRQAMLQMEQQKLDQARDQQMYQRRAGETESLGNFFGKMFPYVYEEYKRGLDRKNNGVTPDNPLGATTDYNPMEVFQYQGHNAYRDQQGRIVSLDTGQPLYEMNEGQGPDAPYVYDAPGVTERPGTVTGGYGTESVTTPPGQNYPTYGEDPELLGRQYMDVLARQPYIAQNYTQPVEFQTGFALDSLYPNRTVGTVGSYRGQRFMYMPNGWMKQ